MKSYTYQSQRIRSFEAMEIISTVMISYYLFLYHAPYICFCCIFIAFFFHYKWMLINSDLLGTNEWIDSIESITRLIQWICLMRYILSLTIFSFTNNTVAIHAKQRCLTINLSADRKKNNKNAHKPLNKEK